MKRRHSIEADHPPAPARDADAALSAALSKLALLRQQVHADWSAGIAELVAFANADDATTDDAAWSIAGPAPFADGLRGRFIDLDERIAAPKPVAAPAAEIDTSWLSLATPVAPPLQKIRITRALAESAAAEDVEVRMSGVGAFVNFDMLASPPAPPAPKPVEDEEPATGYGATADILALIAPASEPPARSMESPPGFVDDAPLLLAPGAAAGLDALLALTAPVAPPDIAAAPASFVDTHDETPDVAFGAHAALATLFDSAPPLDTNAREIRAFDPQSLIDDALADAFETLLCAHDPLESAWAADAVAFDADAPANHLAQHESALWNLPRHVPCIETFLATPNHETAVKLTRALRLRAHALEARAFAEGVDFGFLRTDADAVAFWFMADALCDATGVATGDVEASFPDWQMSDGGLIVVNAPGLAPHRPKPPLISEAELDALFAHVDEARAHVLDDLGDDQTWSEPYWSDVDAYLANEATSWEADDLDHLPAPYDPAHEILDIDVRDDALALPATHFWIPGDETDLAIAGDGCDLFIVGGGEGDDAAVILLEDGATYAMRTGFAARMDEVIVSLSQDPWTHIDAMRWTRLAALSGVANVRVEQNLAASRRLVLAGAFAGTALDDGGARLVRSGDDGEEDHPVLRLGEATAFSFAA